MGDDKIRITWEDVQDPRVDERVRQQSAQARAAQHYHQVAAPPAGQPIAPAGGGTSIWYNTLVYMTLFGMAGGFLAWGVGELVMLVQNSMSDTATKAAVQKLEAYSEDLMRRLNEDIRVGRKTRAAAQAEYDAKVNEFGSQLGSGLRWRSITFSIVFCLFCGGSMACFLGMADPFVERNWPMAAFQGAMGLLAGIIGGVIVGSFIDTLYRAMGAGKPGSGLFVQIVGRAISWAIIGMFLSVSAGLVLRNWKKCLCGLAGGVIGGLIGGCLFDPIAMATKSGGVSRFVGLIVIGAMSGLATGLIENAAKTGWLRVLRGVIAGKQFILYRNPTWIGSSPQCEIYLFKDTAVAPRHAALHTVSGGFELEDLQTGMPTYVNGRPIRRQRLRHEDQVQIGATVFLFQERRRQA